MISCTFENGRTGSLRHVVVHALVAKDNSLLLVRRAPQLLEGGKWSLPAGFLDRDESAAAAVLRELSEETGWEGEVVHFFRINTNPDRPHEDRQNVALDFIIRPRRQTGTPDHESTAIDWVPFTELAPYDRFAFDHGESIRLYLEYLKKPFSIPLFS